MSYVAFSPAYSVDMPSARLARELARVVLALLCQACGATTEVTAPPTTAQPIPSCPVPDSVQLELEASDRVNLDETGRSLPTRLRLYQLSELNPLQNASFDELWSNARSALGDSIVGVEEVVLYPGQVSVHRFKREPRAEFVAAVAILRDPQGETWRTAQEWPAPGDPCQKTGQKHAVPSKLRIRVFLEDNRIESVTNFFELPKRLCPPGSEPCAPAAFAPELRRNRHLRTFEEDPREPTAR